MRENNRKKKTKIETIQDSRKNDEFQEVSADPTAGEQQHQRAKFSVKLAEL